MATPAAPAIPDIVREHLEELGFLSLTRRKLIVDWETDLPELAEHDERIAAHRDALHVAGAVAVEHARECLQDPLSAWDTYACARVILEQESVDPVGLRELLSAADDETFPGWREAFRRGPRSLLALLPADPFAEDDAPLRALTIDAAGWHGRLADAAHARALTDPDPAVRAAAARTLPWAPGASRDPGVLLAGVGRDDDPHVRRVAMWSMALVAAPAALQAARTALADANPDPCAVRVVGLLGDAGDRVRLERRGADPAALRALGDLGHAGALPHLAEALGEETTALPAAEAISRIAGFPEGHSDEPDEETLDVDAYRALAAQKQAVLTGDGRWLRGVAFPPAAPDEEETTESVWRRLVRGGGATKHPLGREVPDGFYTGAPGEESECGV